MTIFSYTYVLHPDGRRFVLIAAALTLLSFLLGWEVFGALGVVVTAWVLWFFRDPKRFTPQGADLVVSPADGAVCLVGEAPLPPELGLGHEMRPRVSIFLNIFDVHINRTPVAGVVKKLLYIPGKFLSAHLDKASEDNERQYYVISAPGQADIVVTQIAGLIARRIVRFSQEGDTLIAGQRIGLIRFGSRVDVYLPTGVVPQVAVGQRVIAGESVIARLGVATPLSVHAH